MMHYALFWAAEHGVMAVWVWIDVPGVKVDQKLKNLGRFKVFQKLQGY